MTNDELQRKALLPVKTVAKMFYGDATPCGQVIMGWITDGINGLRLPAVDCGKKNHRYYVSVEVFGNWLDEVAWEAGVIANAPRKAAEPTNQTDLTKQAEAAMRRIQNL